jgi:hypothetical protein
MLHEYLFMLIATAQVCQPDGARIQPDSLPARCTVAHVSHHNALWHTAWVNVKKLDVA